MAIIAGILCGFLSGLGIGGGSLLIVFLTASLGMEQTAARGINLLFFLPSAAAALIFHSKNRCVDWTSVRWIIPGGIVSAVLGVWCSGWIPTTLLQKLFGAFLLFIGISELLNKPNAQEK